MESTLQKIQAHHHLKSFEETVIELYSKVEVVKFEQSEFISTYKQYSYLKQEYNKAIDKSSTPIYKIDSKEEKKEKKKQRKEGKKSAKDLLKELKSIEQILNPMMSQFDLAELGGIEGVKLILQNAEGYDREKAKELEGLRRRVEFHEEHPEINIVGFPDKDKEILETTTTGIDKVEREYLTNVLNKALTETSADNANKAQGIEQLGLNPEHINEGETKDD